MLSEVTTKEAQQDLETLCGLFKKYHVCFAGNLEVTNDTYMEALESITKTIATCKLIEETYNIHLGIDELLKKREELLSEWESTFEVKL